MNLRSKYLFFLILLLVIIGLISQFKCSTSPETQAKSYLNLHDSVQYVGMNTCKQCHQDKFESFMETGMGQSFHLAHPKNSSAEFSKQTLVYDSSTGLSYHPFWEADSLRILEFRLNNKDTVYKRTETIKYIVGSGQHTNSHMVDVEGYLFQAPLTYYTQTKQWDLPPGFENGANSRFNRLIGLECMSCHNAYPTFAQGSVNKFDSIPQGIDCERCHGPGEIHVKQKLEGKLVDIKTEIDYSIVNPGKLSAELQFDVCSRCHIQGNAVLAEGKSFLDFRPGMKLSDIMTIFMPRFIHPDEEFIMASHVERLKMSQCFKQSMDSDAKNRKSLTCVSCHDPHVSVLETSTSTFNATCRSCHGKAENKCTEKVNVRALKEDNCVSCHMKNSGTKDIPHVMTTDHYIRKPISETATKKIQEFAGLIAINDKNPSKATIAKAYLQYFEKFEAKLPYLDSAEKYLRASDQSKTIADQIHLFYLQNNPSKLVQFLEKNKITKDRFNQKSLDNKDAFTSYRIGESYTTLGNINQAEQWFQHAIELCPLNPEFRNKLGANWISQGKFEDAIPWYEEMTKMYPKFAPAYSNLGYAMLVSKNDLLLAAELYEKALAINPDYEQALMNKAGLLLHMKKNNEAKTIIQRVLTLNPSNEQAKSILLKI